MTVRNQVGQELDLSVKNPYSEMDERTRRLVEQSGKDTLGGPKGGGGPAIDPQQLIKGIGQLSSLMEKGPAGLIENALGSDALKGIETISSALKTDLMGPQLAAAVPPAAAPQMQVCAAAAMGCC
jgi:hypothetical protein